MAGVPEPAAAVRPQYDGPAPSTFTDVSDAELEALADRLLTDPEDATVVVPPIATPFLVEAAIRYAEDDDDDQFGVARSDEEEPEDLEAAATGFQDEETPTFSAKDWQRVRSQTARLRKPPGAPKAFAAA